MAAYEVLLLNTAIPQIQAAQAGDTYVVPRDIAINATAIISANSATDALRITQTGAGNAILVEDSANPDSTPFVVTAAGDVGIGTPSPGARLDLAGTASGVSNNFRLTSFSFQNAFMLLNQPNNGNYRSFEFQEAGSTTGYLRQYGSAYGTSLDSIIELGNGSSTLRFNSSGNLGLGITPSAWAASAIDVAGWASFAQRNTNGWTLVGGNVYWDGSNYKYKNSSTAALYELRGPTGVHAWLTAPSGTAGNTISFTQAMTLDLSGRLLVKATSNTGTNTKLAVGAGLTSGNAVAYISTEDVDVDGVQISNWTGSATTNRVSLGFDSSGVGGFRIGIPGGVNAFQIYDSVAATERARISSDGTFRVKGAGTAGSTDAVQFSGSAPASAMTLDSSGNLLVGETSSNSGNNGLKVKGQFALTTSQAFTASGSVNDSAYYIVCYSLSATCTLTLPTPANNTGRLLNIVVQSAQQVVSASSNVTAITNGALGTAILPATAGKWAQLWCDGTYWNIIATNV